MGPTWGSSLSRTNQAWALLPFSDVGPIKNLSGKSPKFLSHAILTTATPSCVAGIQVCYDDITVTCSCYSSNVICEWCCISWRVRNNYYWYLFIIAQANVHWQIFYTFFFNSSRIHVRYNIFNSDCNTASVTLAIITIYSIYRYRVEQYQLAIAV